MAKKDAKQNLIDKLISKSMKGEDKKQPQGDMSFTIPKDKMDANPDKVLKMMADKMGASVEELLNASPELRQLMEDLGGISDVHDAMWKDILNGKGYKQATVDNIPTSRRAGMTQTEIGDLAIGLARKHNGYLQDIYNTIITVLEEGDDIIEAKEVVEKRFNLSLSTKEWMEILDRTKDQAERHIKISELNGNVGNEQAFRLNLTLCQHYGEMTILHIEELTPKEFYELKTAKEKLDLARKIAEQSNMIRGLMDKDRMEYMMDQSYKDYEKSLKDQIKVLKKVIKAHGITKELTVKEYYQICNVGPDAQQNEIDKLYKVLEQL